MDSHRLGRTVLVIRTAFFVHKKIERVRYCNEVLWMQRPGAQQKILRRGDRIVCGLSVCCARQSL